MSFVGVKAFQKAGEQLTQEKQQQYTYAGMGEIAVTPEAMAQVVQESEATAQAYLQQQQLKTQAQQLGVAVPSGYYVLEIKEVMKGPPPPEMKVGYVYDLPPGYASYQQWQAEYIRSQKVLEVTVKPYPGKAATMIQEAKTQYGIEIPKTYPFKEVTTFPKAQEGITGTQILQIAREAGGPQFFYAYIKGGIKPELLYEITPTKVRGEIAAKKLEYGIATGLGAAIEKSAEILGSLGTTYTTVMGSGVAATAFPPVVTVKGLVTAPILSVGVGEAVSLIAKQRPLTVPEVVETALMGEVFYIGTSGLLAGLGTGASKVWKGIKYVTPSRIKEPLGYAVKFGRPAKLAYTLKRTVTSRLPMWRGSSLDIWLAKHSGWYFKSTGGIARGEVAFPLISEPISFAKLKAASLAFEMTVVPRTGGVWLGKTLVEPTKKSMKHLIARGGKISIGYLAEYGFQKVRPEVGLTPLVSQTQLTRMGIYPYVPKVASTSILGKKGVTTFASALGATTLLKLPQPPKRKEKEFGITIPKVWQPTLARERVKYSPLEVPTLIPKKREKAVPFVKIGQPVKLAQPSRQIQIALPSLKLSPITITPTPLPSPSPVPYQPPAIPPLFPRWGGGFGRGRRRGLKYGGWFFKKHPVETPERFAKKLLGARSTKRRGLKSLLPKRKKGRKNPWII